MTPLLPAVGADARDIAIAVNQAINGKLNSVGTVTLTHDVGSTTVKNALIGVSSAVFLFPQTANGAAELGAGTAYIAPADYVAKTSFKITHANNAQTDRTFGFLIVG